MSSTTFSAFGSGAARTSAAITTTAAPPAAASVGRCTRSPAAGACSRHSGRRWNYARALNNDPDAKLDDVREAVTTLQDAGRTARQVLGGANPTTVDIEGALQTARAHLRARETLSAS